MVNCLENVISNRHYVLLMFNPDSSFNEEAGFHVLSDIFNYQDELRAFKEQNG